MDDTLDDEVILLDRPVVDAGELVVSEEEIDVEDTIVTLEVMRADPLDLELP